MEKKVSEQIEGFLDFVDGCQELNSVARCGAIEEEKRQQDLLHAIEFENEPEKWLAIAERLHWNRVDRRKYKDQFEVTEGVVEFAKNPQNKKVLDSARQLLGKVRKIEKYHETRTYIPRIKEDG